MKKEKEIHFYQMADGTWRAIEGTAQQHKGLAKYARTLGVGWMITDRATLKHLFPQLDPDKIPVQPIV